MLEIILPEFKPAEEAIKYPIFRQNVNTADPIPRYLKRRQHTKFMIIRCIYVYIVGIMPRKFALYFCKREIEKPSKNGTFLEDLLEDSVVRARAIQIESLVV